MRLLGATVLNHTPSHFNHVCFSLTLALSSKQKGSQLGQSKNCSRPTKNLRLSRGAHPTRNSYHPEFPSPSGMTNRGWPFSGHSISPGTPVLKSKIAIRKPSNLPLACSWLQYIRKDFTKNSSGQS